jgi:hypothetical protein
VSARAAGLRVGYVNANFPFGATDVGPAALAMKKRRGRRVVLQTESNTAFALITALRNEGVNLKVASLPAGCGGDLLQAGPGALNAAQNVYVGAGRDADRRHQGVRRRPGGGRGHRGTRGQFLTR